MAPKFDFACRWLNGLLKVNVNIKMATGRTRLASRRLVSDESELQRAKAVHPFHDPTPNFKQISTNRDEFCAEFRSEIGKFSCHRSIYVTD